ncbi:MutS family DNA mismatch repair protein [Haloimpatiens sp. FM7330]|uniref:MutS family DNA mismatch repair protein n=1 Tax=Haloimpatiens sp. FM7330 TaxID=3298610 RepID=UPI00363E4EDA
MTVKETFVQRVKYFENEQLKYKKVYNILSIFRLIVFALALICTYYFIKERFSTAIFLGMIISYVVFLILLSKHSNINDKLKKIKCMIDINKKYIHRIDGKWTDFDDCGKEYVHKDHSYSMDLDIFGLKSLFQLINTTKTFYGRKRLTDLLQKPEKDIEMIMNRQNAVKELAQKIDFCQNLECQGISNEKSTENPEKLLQYAENSKKAFKKSWIKWIIYILPVISIAVSFTIIFYNIKKYYYFIPLLIILHIIINLLGYSKISPVINSVYGFKKDLEAYVKILNLIENENFENSYLKKLKSELVFENKKASQIFKQLNKIGDNIDLRKNVVFFIVSNIVLFWDHQCVFALENWKEHYGNSIRKWLEIIGEIESISSLSVLMQLNPSWTFPVFAKEDLVIDTEEVGHPLINAEKRVCNNVDMTNNILIITGSNMSGKTTFLRTIGINLVLAYAGAPVCAKRFKCSIMDIFTSMRISDDLNEGLSTFYFELLRIKNIIDYLPKKQPTIFLIDEIFRGTNSKDRIIGAKSVLKNLNKSWVFGLISTHDFELCDLEHADEKRIKNYHFTESYLNNKIQFDYKLRKGRSDTTNAKYLMKMIGIDIEE